MLTICLRQASCPWQFATKTGTKALNNIWKGELIFSTRVGIGTLANRFPVRHSHAITTLINFIAPGCLSPSLMRLLPERFDRLYQTRTRNVRKGQTKYIYTCISSSESRFPPLASYVHGSCGKPVRSFNACSWAITFFSIAPRTIHGFKVSAPVESHEWDQTSSSPATRESGFSSSAVHSSLERLPTTFVSGVTPDSCQWTHKRSLLWGLLLSSSLDYCALAPLSADRDWKILIWSHWWDTFEQSRTEWSTWVL